MLSSMPEPDSSYPKPLDAWIDLDYFRRRRSWFSLGDHFLRRRRREDGKWILIGAVLVACLAWPLAAQLLDNRRIYQAGPLSNAHALFNNDCHLCHTDSLEPVSRFLPANAGMATVKDEACTKCHDGPIHHAVQVEDRSCAVCHREHRGHAELARVADSQCTSCHGDLKRRDGQPSPFENVHGWAADHPEFGLRRRKEPDRAAIRFNHSVHLKAEGMNDSDGKSVVSNCTQCHREGSAGRTMRPIHYEDHCANCHPLAVKVAGADKMVQAPHKEPGVVRAALREGFTRLVQDQPAILVAPVVAPSRRPLPGGTRPLPATGKEWTWVSFQLQIAERVLFDGPGGCRYCHDAKERRVRKGLPEYIPTNIPQRWLAHSIFSHHSHRMVECLECHGRAPTSTKTTDVLLPGVETCRQCHLPKGGARNDCAECHRYHDRTKAQAPQTKTISEVKGRR